jgi:TPR repeat protein
MKTCFRIRPVPFSRGLFASLLLFAAANFSPAQTPPLDGLRVRAEAGDAEAQNAMGLACKNGRGDMAVDFKQAAQWFQKSAEQGNPYAERNLARWSNGCERPLTRISPPPKVISACFTSKAMA